jgi:hypothetical protein
MELDRKVTEGGSFSYDTAFLPIWVSDVAVINDMIFDPFDAQMSIAMGTAGVFFSASDGQGWTRLLSTSALPGYPSGAYFDGLSDPVDRALYVAFNGRGILRLGLPARELQFESAQSFGAGTAPVDVIGADLNRDGITDLATANFGSDDVSVLIGNGDGRFAPSLPFGVSGRNPSAVASADFNGDRQPDLATANFGSNDVSVLPGVGDGRFGPAATFGALGVNPSDIVAADFNRDGRLDLAVANQGFPLGPQNLAVLLGNGDGTFAPAGSFAAGDAPIAITAHDFDRDGRLDLAAANFFSNDVTVLLGNGDGTFGPARPFGVGSFPNALTAADFNSDGNLDLATANFDSANVSVLLGNGDGTFGRAGAFEVNGDGPSGITTADFNRDGRADLATANFTSDDVSVLLGIGDGTFVRALNLKVGLAPTAISANDLNGDGRADLVTANNGSNDVSVLLSIRLP